MPNSSSTPDPRSFLYRDGQLAPDAALRLTAETLGQAASNTARRRRSGSTTGG